MKATLFQHHHLLHVTFHSIIIIKSFSYKQSHLVNCVVNFCSQFVMMIPAGTYDNKQNAKEDVANVGENMIEVCE